MNMPNSISVLIVLFFICSCTSKSKDLTPKEKPPVMVDVIIAGNKGFYNNIYSDPNWQKIKAVQNKQVYSVPTDPFGWFDRPPCLNVIIGIPWTAKVLYPDKFAEIDLKSLTKEYYQKFIHTDLTDDQVTKILSDSGLKNF